MIKSGAIVLFSGGQDSTTCLAWALENFERVETLGFDYGQRHSIELQCRLSLRNALMSMNPGWAKRLGDDRVIELPFIADISQTALTNHIAIEMNAAGLPNTFVPGRNLIFLTVAGALAYRRGLKHIVGGMCETDFSGYPDCRDDSIKAQQVAMSLGMGSSFSIHTPLMWMNKAETWELACHIGGDALVSLIVDSTHTCYLGERGLKHDWGFGCGACPSCKLRAEGYALWLARRLA